MTLVRARSFISVKVGIFICQFLIYNASPRLVSTVCPNGQDFQSKNVTDSQWDSHGQNGQDFPSETVWGLP